MLKASCPHGRISCPRAESKRPKQARPQNRAPPLASGHICAGNSSYTPCARSHGGPSPPGLDREARHALIMGRGGEKLSADGQRGMTSSLRRDSWSFNSLKGLTDLRDDLSTLRHLWFSKAGSARSHAARLEAFYGPQAAACEACASRHRWARALTNPRADQQQGPAQRLIAGNNCFWTPGGPHLGSAGAGP